MEVRKAESETEKDSEELFLPLGGRSHKVPAWLSCCTHTNYKHNLLDSGDRGEREARGRKGEKEWERGQRETGRGGEKNVERCPSYLQNTPLQSQDCRSR